MDPHCGSCTGKDEETTSAAEEVDRAQRQAAIKRLTESLKHLPEKSQLHAKMRADIESVIAEHKKALIMMKPAGGQLDSARIGRVVDGLTCSRRKGPLKYAKALGVCLLQTTWQKHLLAGSEMKLSRNLWSEYLVSSLVDVQVVVLIMHATSSTRSFRMLRWLAFVCLF